MFKLQLFGTEQEVSRVLRTTFRSVCWICPAGSILGGFYLNIHVHLPLISVGWKTALLKREISASLTRGQFPSPTASPNDIWQRPVFLGVVLTEFFSMQHSSGNMQGLQFSLIHFPFRSADSFGLPTVYSCL